MPAQANALHAEFMFFWGIEESDLGQVMKGASVAEVVRAYYLWFGSFLLLIHTGLWLLLNVQDRMPLPSGSPLQKTEFYRQHTARYDLIFLGDSRTYCGLHPDEIDPLLSTRSCNLSMFAHWLPTQYPAIADLVGDIPASTTVVWSIGSGNFAPVGVERTIRDAYPVGLRNVPTYLSWGYRWADLQPNLVRSATQDWPGRLSTKLKAWGEIPVSSREASRAESFTQRVTSQPTDRSEKELEKLLLKCRADPRVSNVEILRDPAKGTVTSVAVMTADGAYRRYELDRRYFRQQQAAHAEELNQQRANEPGAAEFHPDAAYWKTFLAILKLFERHQVRVIVNEIPEAPYVYRHSAAARAEREFIRMEARRAVELHGFRWVSADVSSLKDDDYFDHNHLNSQGIERYSRLMADVLGPLLHSTEKQRRR